MKENDLAGYFPANTPAFWDDLALIDHRVSMLLASKASADVSSLFSIQAAVRGEADRDGYLAERLLDFSDALLTLLRLPSLGGQMKQPSGFVTAAVSAIEPERRAQGRRKNMSDAVLEQEVHELPAKVNHRIVEVLMEYMTGAWLGMYFLGIPMPQPWDGVRRLAEQVGGVPSGPCIYKYIGDIYRTARQQVIREDGERLVLGQAKPTAESEEAKTVFVLTYRPLALLEEDIARAPVRNLTPAALQSLGQHYAVLQMRLYTQQKFPIRYFVPKRALGRSITYMLWDRFNVSGEVDISKKITNELGNTAEKIHEALKRNFCSASASCQSVRLLEPSDTASIPTCVLGNKTGVYSLDGTQTLLHFTGNQIRDELLFSYQRKMRELNKLAGNAPKTSMLTWSVADILAKIDEVVLLALADDAFMARLTGPPP